MPKLVTNDAASYGDLPHTVEVDENSRAIRLYLWTYMASASRINTCKLFWAFVFLPLALPFSAVIHGLARLARWADDRWGDDSLPTYTPPSEPTGPSKGEKTLESVSGFMAKAWFRIQPLLKWGGIAIGVLLAAAIVGGLVLIILSDPMGVLTVVLIFLGVCVAAAVLVGLFAGAIHLLDKSDRVHGFFRLMGQLYRSVHDHTCANVRVKRNA